ncbi:hypothetical protein [Streptomyces vastus]|uniref:hypothetical protein n=1 Tax=Streptomyces vastus TaxID=285451 RepID=UPI0031DE4C9F
MGEVGGALVGRLGRGRLGGQRSRALGVQVGDEGVGAEQVLRARNERGAAQVGRGETRDCQA